MKLYPVVVLCSLSSTISLCSFLFSWRKIRKIVKMIQVFKLIQQIINCPPNLTCSLERAPVQAAKAKNRYRWYERVLNPKFETLLSSLSSIWKNRLSSHRSAFYIDAKIEIQHSTSSHRHNISAWHQSRWYQRNVFFFVILERCQKWKKIFSSCIRIPCSRIRSCNNQKLFGKETIALYFWCVSLQRRFQSLKQA